MQLSTQRVARIFTLGILMAVYTARECYIENGRMVPFLCFFKLFSYCLTQACLPQSGGNVLPVFCHVRSCIK